MGRPLDAKLDKIRMLHGQKTQQIKALGDEIGVIDQLLEQLGHNHPGIWALVTDFEVQRCTFRAKNFVIRIRVSNQVLHMETVQKHLEELLDILFLSNISNTDPTIKKKADWGIHIIELGV